jgi:hypothetical protein
MSQTDDAWTDVADQLRSLGTTVKSRYDALAGVSSTESVSDDEVRDALSVLGKSLSAAIGAVGVSFRDPEVTSEVKETAASFFGALGVSFSEIAAGIAAHRDPGDVEDFRDAAAQDDVEHWDPSEDE